MTPETEVYAAKLRAMMPELAERYGVTELGLFGSRVRGDHRPDSDLDVLVEFKPHFCLSYLKLAELNNLLSERLELSVDLVPREDLKPTIGRHVMKEVLYL